MFEKIALINPDLITDEHSRATVVLLLNGIETLQHMIQGYQKEIQSLKDEIALLKGEQGKPIFHPKKEDVDNFSSEKFTKPIKIHQKLAKKQIIPIDKTIVCPIDKTTLPFDAKYQGYDTVIQQNIIFKRENIEFKIEVWYSASLHKTYRAEAPGYEGYFGNNLKAFSIVMHHFADVTCNKLLAIYRSLEIEISDGSLQNILKENSESWIGEKRDLLSAGLMNSFTQTDTTSTTVAGETWRTHVICSNWFVVFATLEGKSRRHLLFALQGEPETGLMFIYNQTTIHYLDHFKISQSFKNQLNDLFASDNNPLSELEFNRLIAKRIPDLLSKPIIFNKIGDAFALGYYYGYQTDFPVVRILISDDAPEYKLVGEEQGLCWIHDGRFYIKLLPIIEFNKKVLEEYQNRYWLFYKRLLEYKEKPSEESKQSIISDFDALVVPNTPYDDLNKVIERTRDDKAHLLLVLDHPEIPLHNNNAELAARQEKRKGDISLHTMTRLGTQLQDAFMSIVNTCKILKINAFTYILERISKKNSYYLPDLVKEKSLPSAVR